MGRRERRAEVQAGPLYEGLQPRSVIVKVARQTHDELDEACGLAVSTCLLPGRRSSAATPVAFAQLQSL